MQGFTKILLGAGLLSLSVSALAQNAPTATPPVPPTPPILPLAAPTSVPSFPKGATQPMIDAASNTYLPWLGKNLENLVAYDVLFWQLQQANIGSATAAYMSPVTMLANSQFVPIVATTSQNAASLTLNDLQSMLAYGGKNPTPDKLSGVTGTDNTPPNGKQPASDDAFVNADTILGTSSYLTMNGKDPSPAAVAVNQLVQFLTGQAQPLGGLTFSNDPTTFSNQLGQQDVKNYLLESRAAAAAQSVAISNIHYVAQERAIIQGLGTQAGMTTLPTDGTQQQINDASQLQLEQFLVDRRVGNTSWYSNVNSASQIAVERETLFVLAEISKQTFEQKLLLERMLAEMIAMQQSTSQVNQTKINYDLQTVQQSLSATAASTQSTSASSGGSSSGGSSQSNQLSQAQQQALKQAQSSGITIPSGVTVPTSPTTSPAG